MCARLLRNARACILNGQEHIVLHAAQTYTDPALVRIVFYGVFDEIKCDLIQIILHRHEHATLAQLGLDGNAAQFGQRTQHPHNLLHHRNCIENFAFVLDRAVEFRQGQELLRKAAEAVGLASDVANEFAFGLLVHFVL